MKEALAYSVTKYPRIFEPTYWGYFDINENDRITDTIIQNRNRLVKEYELNCNIPMMYKKYEKDTILIGEIPGQKVRDHAEYYSAKNKRLISLFSTYDMSEKFTDLAIRSGYQLIYPIYSIDNSNTFVKVIHRRR